MLRATAVLIALLFCGGAASAQTPRDCIESPRLPPDHREFYLSRGICLLNAGDVERAMADFNQFISLNPNWVAGYFNRGNAYFRQAEYDLAIADYTEALRHRPADPDGIFWNRGNAHAEKRDYLRAIADYDQAIALRPNFSDFYRIRAETHEKAGDRDKAIADYRRALALDPANLAAQNGLQHLTSASSWPPFGSSSAAVTIDAPRYGNRRLDWCRYWARSCGRPAADEFCRRHGFAGATAFSQAPRIGATDPTSVIGTGQICDRATCTGFASITCSG
jgi:tetratricopeptide (TPR) repeat protein